jgi:hypothetical protein
MYSRFKWLVTPHLARTAGRASGHNEQH